MTQRATLDEHKTRHTTFMHPFFYGKGGKVSSGETFGLLIHTRFRSFSLHCDMNSAILGDRSNNIGMSCRKVRQAMSAPRSQENGAATNAANVALEGMFCGAGATQAPRCPRVWSATRASIRRNRPRPTCGAAACRPHDRMRQYGRPTVREIAHVASRGFGAPPPGTNRG